MLQFLRVLLHPLGRADQAFLFGVPTAEDHGALRPPAVLQQRADPVYCLQHRGRSAVGIDGAVHPGIAMIARHHPVVRIALRPLPCRSRPRWSGAGNPAPRRGGPSRRLVLHVIAEGQRALPSLRHVRALEVFKNGLGVVIADGDGDDVRLIALGRYALRVGQVGRRGHAGRFRIARVLEKVLHRSPLHARCRAPRSVRVDVALVVAVVLGIGVDEYARRSRAARQGTP